MANIEKTLVLVKPDGVKKHICGEVISRFERKGLSIHAIKMIQVPVELAEEHYAEHKGKGFFKALIDFITSGPVLAMVIEGENAVAAVRQINGATNPLEAVPGSIRGDFATSIDENVVHASDAVEEDHIRLQPENDEYQPIIAKEVIIRGKVIGLYRHM